ncbi:MAG: hypothetical protein H7066_11970 [Cytophagaceae bacterium]|nr:hypothetical protein [Gemmatimonadaceae bacterium]
MMQIFFRTNVRALRFGSTLALIAGIILVPQHRAAAEAAPAAARAPSSGADRMNDALLLQASQSDTARKAKPAAKPARDTAIKRPPKPVVEWPVKGPEPLPGSILPAKRIIAYYGNPLSKRMGILGELPPDQMLARLDKEVAAWNKADSTTPAIPALHLIVTVAQGSAGRDGKWRARMADTLISRVQEWAARRNALLFLDIQVGKSTIRDELPHLAPWLAKPNVHLGVDPEFMMKGGHAPGKRIGSIDARDINWVTEFLSRIVTENKIPPKVFVVHRFTRPMVTNYRKIELDPRVQVVMHMDGWGPPHLKRGTYDAYVYAEPVQFTGFKLFYKNDTKKGHPLMKPADLLALTPRPVYIQYQ